MNPALDEDLPRILVVDDCRINLLLVRHILAKTGLKVDTAGTGNEGVAMASQRRYRLIFLDIMLPDIDGFEVCRRIRAQEMGERARIIFLTAMGEAFSQEKAKKVGADDVYFKPIVPSQILERTREICCLQTT